MNNNFWTKKNYLPIRRFWKKGKFEIEIKLLCRFRKKLSVFFPKLKQKNFHKV